jgi:hypothetical protein
LRFSVGQLLVVTAIVSVALMVMVMLTPPLWSLAMASPSPRAFSNTLLEPFTGSGVWLDYARRMPHFIVWGVGCALLVRRRKRHPRVSLCALTGLAGLLLLDLVAIGFSLWMCYRIKATGGAPQSLSAPSMYSDAAGLYYRLIRPAGEACCWALILMAILGWRGVANNQDKANQAQ